MGKAAQWRGAVVVSPCAQQALYYPEPEAAEGDRDPPQAGEELRRPGREFSAWTACETWSFERGAAPGAAGSGGGAYIGLWPGWSLPRPGRLRGYWRSDWGTALPVQSPPGNHESTTSAGRHQHR